MTTAPVRCTAPHPDDPCRPCNARLMDEIGKTVALAREDHRSGSGVAVIQCRRCGTRYTVSVRAA